MEQIELYKMVLILIKQTYVPQHATNAKRHTKTPDDLTEKLWLYRERALSYGDLWEKDTYRELLHSPQHSPTTFPDDDDSFAACIIH